MTEQEQWDAIRADYLSGEYSVPELAQKYGASESTIYKKASKDGWKKMQEKIRQKADEKYVARAARIRAKELEVISEVTPEQQEALAAFLDHTPITVKPALSDLVLDIWIHVYAGEEQASVRIINHHTGLASILHNGKVLLEQEPVNPAESSTLDYDLLCVADIYDFAQSLDVNDVKELFDLQMAYNCAIAEEGLTNIVNLAADLTITERRYVGHDDDTGYHNYAIDVAHYYEMEE